MLIFLLTFIVLYINLYRAQFAYVIQDNNYGFGQCIQDSDCLIYLSVNPMLNSSQIFCDPATTRCTTLSGTILTPAYSAACDYLIINTISYPTFAPNFLYPNPREDGMLMVTLSPVTYGFGGALRIYLDNVGTINVNTPYHQQRYVNYPTSTIYFRSLVSGTYKVVFFGTSGCQLAAIPNPVITVSSLVRPTAYDTNSGFFDVSGLNVYLDPTGRGARMYLTSPWNKSIDDYNYIGPGIGTRMPFVQIYDTAGGLLDIVIGNDLFYNTSEKTNYSYAGGATFPLRAPESLFSSVLEATFVSGFVTFQFGIGFAYVPCANLTICFPIFVKSTLGTFEGIFSQPFVLDCNSVGPGMQQIPPYTETPMFYIVDGVYSNTVFLYEGVNFDLGELVRLQMHPDVTIVYSSTITGNTGGFNGMCFSASNAFTQLEYASVFLDYRAFPFEINSPDLVLYQVLYQGYYNGSEILTNRLYLAQMDPPQQRLILNGIYEVMVYIPGFYCAVLQANLFDPYGYRTFFQTCFQVPNAQATLTPVNSVYINNGYASNASTVFGGIYTPVNYSFIPNFPMNILLKPGQVFQVLFNRWANDTTQEYLLVNQGGANKQTGIAYTEVYSITAESAGLYNMYNVVPYPNASYIDYYLMTLAVDVNNPNFYVYFYLLGGETVLSELMSVSMQVYEQGELDLIYAFHPTDIPYPWAPQYNITLAIIIGGGQANLSALYNCTNIVSFPMQESIAPQAQIIVGSATCPGVEVAMYAYSGGGIPFATIDLANPLYLPNSQKFAYDNTWFNVFNDTSNIGDPLLWGNNQYLFPAPQNTIIKLVSCDVQGRCSVAFAEAVSVISPNATIISFFPQVPVCVYGNVSNFTHNLQQVELAYSVNNMVDGRIEYWSSVSISTPDDYDPNQISSNIPSQCALLQNLTAYQVYELCGASPSPPMPQCNGCVHLPVQYEKANGRTLITAVNNEWWQVNVWTPVPDTFNSLTNRSLYCLTSSTIKSDIPVPITATFGQVARTSSNCLSNDGCFYTTINIIVDGSYSALYAASVQFYSNPTLVPYLGNALPNQYLVTLGQVYNITLLVPNILCTVDLNYLPTSLGPIITTIRTKEAYCNPKVGTGAVTMYALYNNPSTNPALAGTLAPVCFYWPGRRGSSFAADDEVPIQFFLPVNVPQPTLLPYLSAFGIDNQFTGIVGGVQQVMIYDRCRLGVNAGLCTCKNPLPMNFQLLEAGLSFAYQEFNTSTFQDTQGGLIIELNEYMPANCYGDEYYWNFTIFDDAGFGPYSIVLQEPETGYILFSAGGCIITNTTVPLPPPTPYGPFQVIVATFSIVLPTADRGLGPSGNYTLIVRSCKSGCVQTYPTYIKYVTPLFIQLSTAGTNCAYRLATLEAQIIGGSPCQQGDPCYQEITPPGGNITYPLQYTQYWKTPTNPTNFTQVFLAPGEQLPGYYELYACDRNSCCLGANITVETLPPIVVHSITTNGVCQNQDNVTARFNVSGGDGNYYVLQAVTSIQTGQIIDAQFVATYNQTIVFNVMDGTGCINPENITFRLPDPGPVPIISTVNPSCPNLNNGVISVTSTESISCSWQSSGVVIPNIQSCTLTNIVPGAYLVVTVTNLIGCTGQKGFNMSAQPQIVINPVTRTTNGQLGGPCIDFIYFQVTGGEYGPPFILSLFENTTPQSNISSIAIVNGTQFGVVEGVCRSVEYYIMAQTPPSGCSNIYISTDPDFNAGFSPVGLLSLPSPNPRFQVCIPPPVAEEVKLTSTMFWIEFGAIVIVSIMIMLMFVFLRYSF